MTCLTVKTNNLYISLCHTGDRHTQTISYIPPFHIKSVSHDEFFLLSCSSFIVSFSIAKNQLSYGKKSVYDYFIFIVSNDRSIFTFKYCFNVNVGFVIEQIVNRRCLFVSKKSKEKNIYCV